MAGYLDDYCHTNHLFAQVKQFPGGRSYLDSGCRFDLIFLDIYMEGLDGMSTAELIRREDKQCLIVFSTSSREHGVDSYQVHAFDYLLKPYGYERFVQVMTRCDEVLQLRDRYIELKVGRSLQKVLLRDIIYTDYFNHYIQLHLKQGMIRSYMQFRDFSALLLRYDRFLCCYRNCLVNMDEVAIVDEQDFIMTDGERVPIARANRAALKQQYADYVFRRLNGGIFLE